MLKWFYSLPKNITKIKMSSTIENIVRPNQGRGRPKNQYTETEEYSK